MSDGVKISQETARRLLAEWTEPLTFSISFTRLPDDRIKAKSPDVPGLFLASHDFDALCRDLSVSVRDLLRENRGITL